MKERGYAVEMLFLRLGSPELVIKRVAQRVKQGGHHVPPEDVRRRYVHGITLNTNTARWPTHGRCMRIPEQFPYPCSNTHEQEEAEIRI